jgi:hypothetical protein
MSYYMGDFYRGDFRRGDPGFLSAIGGLAKRVFHAVLPGGGGAITKTVERLPAPREAVQAVVRAVKGHPVLSAAGAAGAIGVGGVLAGRMGAPAAGMRGFHVSRKTGHLVKNRHMRATNPRALRRALRRVGGFARLARRVMSFTHPGRKGKLRFKFHRRKK